MPRPKVINEPTTTYNLLMATRTYDAVARHARASGLSVAEVIRQAVNAWLAPPQERGQAGTATGVGAG